ncbi:MAG: hypothetical protein ACQCXQ_02785 [Verrucomicrobiales bacterium]|nr:hypothetical protein [Verrucomicrobiota bacterium JB025]
MKAPLTVLTHAAVFGAGLAIAWIALRPESNPPGTANSGNHPTRTSSRSPHGDHADAAARTSSARSATQIPGARRFTGSPAEQLSRITQLGDPVERQAALHHLLSRLSPDEFHDVAEQYRNANHLPDSGGEFDLILRMWTKSDPLAALTYATDELGNRGDTSTVLSAWAGTNPHAAEQWARENYDGQGQNPFMASVIRGIAAYDLDYASKLTGEMPAGRERNRAIDSIARALLVQGADAAMAFPASIEDDNMRSRYIDLISTNIARSEPTRAAEWLASMTEADDQRHGALRVGRELAKSDTEAATSWISRLDPSAQSEAARGIIPVMSNNDIAGTARWLAELPTDMPGHDRVVEEFVWSCDQRDPYQSAAWIAGIANRNQRTKLYHRMLGNWAKRDPQAVREWVATNEVPRDVQRRFAGSPQ